MCRTNNDHDDDDLFDSDMIEQSVMDYNPMRSLKHKIPWSENTDLKN